MEGKTCLITGGSDGIGYSAARELARMGARVVILGRNAAKTDAAVQRIIAETGNRAVERLLADLSSQREVRRVAAETLERLPRLDVLLNNAGAIFLSNRRSVDGLEMTFALNHIGYFLLTNLLLERLRESAPARVINVSSSSHGSPGRFRLEDLPKPGSNRGYRAYGRSKLCNILFTYELGAAAGRNEHHRQRPASRPGADQHRPQQRAAGAGGQLLYRRSRRGRRQGSGDAGLPGCIARSGGCDRQVFRGLPGRIVFQLELRY